MRVMLRALAPRTRASEERGATVVMVALSMVVLLGMVALVVDVGAMLGLRRRLVNASDAAALAAAQSCAIGQAGDAAGQADAYARGNIPRATSSAFAPQNCGGLGGGSVSVTYQGNQRLYFAPVLGFRDVAHIQASATAIWQGAAGAIAIPVEVSLQNGQVPCISQPIGAPCNYWHDQGNNAFPDDSNWGFMNLGEQWNVGANDSCHDPGAPPLQGWIHTGLHVQLNPTGPTYVCVSHGFEHSTWFNALAAEAGQIKVFPVNDPATMIRTPGWAKYSIVGFVALRVERVLAGNDPEALVECPGHTKDANAVCVVATWQGFRLGGFAGAGGRDFGLRTIRLSA